MPKLFKSEFGAETQQWCDFYSKSQVINSIPTMDLDERLRKVEERLLLVAPPESMMSKYPALAEAYKEYKMIERLILSNEK